MHLLQSRIVCLETDIEMKRRQYEEVKLDLQQVSDENRRLRNETGQSDSAPCSPNHLSVSCNDITISVASAITVNRATEWPEVSITKNQRYDIGQFDGFVSSSLPSNLVNIGSKRSCDLVIMTSDTTPRINTTPLGTIPFSRCTNCS